MKNISEKILRISLSLLLIYFGIAQIMDPQAWTSYIEFSLPDFIDPIYLVLFNAAMEIFFAILIATRVFMKTSALLMGTHVLFIGIMIGFNPTGVRDFALAGAFFALAFLKK